MGMYLTVPLKKLFPLLLALPLIALSFLIPADRAVPAAGNGDAPRPAGRVLIIDAGHGGEDGGASTAEGVRESGINLSIALRLDALARLCGVDTVLTRATEDISYPQDAATTAKRKSCDQRARLQLINSYPDGVLISIHQNFFPDTKPGGCQVLYGAAPGSPELGEMTHAALCAALCPENRRVAAPVDRSIFLLREAGCTAILVECGFLSNPREAALLQQRDYQMKISAVLLTSYLEFSARPEG
jgi:N-acetylmuramoyl-L-alanine amidase